MVSILLGVKKVFFSWICLFIFWDVVVSGMLFEMFVLMVFCWGWIIRIVLCS